jgi:hypothetical protein
MSLQIVQNQQLKPIGDKVAIDTQLSTTSENAISNKAVTEEINRINSDLSDITPSADGFHFKFGVTSNQTGQIGTVTFDTPFPNANYNVFLEPYNDNATLLWASNVITKTTTGFTFRTAYTTNGTNWTNYFNDIQWIAIR